MTQVRFAEADYECRPGESLLDAFLRQGVAFPFSCRKGICHACMCQVTVGTIPPQSQEGLDEEQQAQRFALACRLMPVDDIEVVTVREAVARSAANTTAAPKVTLPDPEMWQALQQGELMSAILKTFYTRVYDDPRLSPFFHGTTMQRSMEKQYSFMRQLFTGEKVYFGDRPRNAHHWMVISNELFDYRERLMETCLREHGLPEHLIARWLTVEGTFRTDIVKDAPWKRVMGGVELPVEGFGETVMDVGTLCDSCGKEINAGTPVRYHLRLGTTYCPECAGKSAG